MYTDESMYHHVPTNTAWKRTFTSIYINLHESGIARYSQTFSSRPEIVFNIYLQDSAVPESWLGGGTGLCWYMPWYTMYVAPWLKQNETEYLVHPYELYNIITIQKLDASGVAVGARKSAGECSLSGAQVLLRSYLACLPGLPGLPPDDEGSWLAGNWLDAKF